MAGAVLLVAVTAVGGLVLVFPTAPEEPALVNPGSATDAVLSPVESPEAVPDLSFVDGAGRPRSLAGFRGKALLLNIWATWCVPCRKEMPALDRLQARLGGPGFEVVALSIDKKGSAVVQAFYAELGLRSLAIYVDESGGAVTELRALGIPLTLLVDAQGREIARAVGAREWDAPEAVEEIRRLLGQAAPLDRRVAAGPQQHLPPGSSGQSRDNILLSIAEDTFRTRR